MQVSNQLCILYFQPKYYICNSLQETLAFVLICCWVEGEIIFHLCHKHFLISKLSIHINIAYFTL